MCERCVGDVDVSGRACRVFNCSYVRSWDAVFACPEIAVFVSVVVGGECNVRLPYSSLVVVALLCTRDALFIACRDRASRSVLARPARVARSRLLFHHHHQLEGAGYLNHVRGLIPLRRGHSPPVSTLTSRHQNWPQCYYLQSATTLDSATPAAPSYLQPQVT